jgi:hypothetical protein
MQPDPFARLPPKPISDHSPGVAARIDTTTSATVTYHGRAKTGASESAPVWQVFKVDHSSGYAVTWADGNQSYDNVWANRASLVYS